MPTPVAPSRGWWPSCGSTPRPSGLPGPPSIPPSHRFARWRTSTVLTSGLRLNKHFFRKGVAGDWREARTAEQANSIEANHAVQMARFGYLPRGS